ncbi:hypothetical protein ABW19_dt0206835 [Dactylella cylindrospora]|nr:hypothetical protein ABW19_dt0206835 [Dactylella cylindrospora]
MSTPAPFIARCLCGTNKIPVPTALPRTAHVCHCTTCRTSHGTLFAMHTDLDDLPFPTSSPPSTLSIYKSSPTSGKAFFCSTCGTYMFASYYYMLEGKQNEGKCVSTGCLELSPEYLASEEGKGKKLEDVLAIDFHCVIKDTIDGGAAAWAGDWTREDLVHFKNLWEEAPASEDDVKAMLASYTYPSGRKELEGWCRCQSAKVKITRDDENIKYRTSICACDSCRLSTGTDVVPFTRVPRQYATFIKDGKEVEWPGTWDDAAKAAFPNLIIYESSPGTIWGACGTCGARIFYQRPEKDEEGNELVQPLTALFGADTTKGILHLDWLDWVAEEDEAIGFIEDAENAGRAGVISKNMSKKYGEWVRTLRSQK